jgi:CubicO group peptidase (beta-lactamase class C family)
MPSPSPDSYHGSISVAYRALAALTILLLLSGCTSTYLGRFASLRTPDVEDYRHMPMRAIAASEQPLDFALALDGDWMRTVVVTHAGRRIEDPKQLDALLQSNGTTAFLLIANGRLIDERYYHGNRRDSMFKCFSISKSVLSAMFGIAQSEGAIAASDRVDAHLTDVGDPALAAVRMEHLLDNVSGFAYERGFAPWKHQPRMYYTTDVRGYVRTAEVVGTPGARFGAEDISPLMLGVALEQALRRETPDVTLSNYMQQRLWQPMGARYSAQWTLDRTDGGIEKTESGLVARAIDFARFGQLYLDGGRANGRQIVPADWVEASITSPAAGQPNRFVEGFHRKLWWGAFRPGRVRDDFYANGHFGQRIYVSPDKALVIVRMGRDGGDVNWTELLGGIADGWPAAKVADTP